MAFVHINPRYQALLGRLGLRTPADFFHLQGIFIGGHAERDIARVTLNDGAQPLIGYLKREHRVRWRDRLRSAFGGFGLVSRCTREAKLLQRLEHQQIGCPEVIAVGENRQGRSFLLVRELADTMSLRPFLGEAKLAVRERRTFAMQLGRALAQIHTAGFYHRDLYSKHVFVRADQANGCPRFVFVDWQRSRQQRRLAWDSCWRDLAALDATLADDLAGPRERLACLVAYRRHWQQTGRVALPSLAQAARIIRRHALRLLRRQRVAEMRQPLRAIEPQSLFKPDEGVCLTRQFGEELRGGLPPWLRFSPQPVSSEMRVTLPVTPPRHGKLVRRHVHRPLGRLWHWLGGRPFVAPEVRQADTLFRLERYGIRAPRLLAYGQQSDRWGRTKTLLLTEELADSPPLAAWLEGPPLRARAVRLGLLREAGAVMRHLHAAACFLPRKSQRLASALCVEKSADGLERVVLANAAAVQRRRRPSPRRAAEDVALLLGTLDVVCTRAEILRFLLAYLDVPHLNNQARRFIRRVRRAQPPVPNSIPWRLGT